ncbi:(Fe-S)-binding protein [Geomonas sp. RF6]|uniref:(Fe-S)-binding protein n=1 Tax=Geomonas sp. RF6 TaxID=2897342 RepID=UPI001E297C7D|nr:(Fe-S)-binding protein [Geomonas sp. RF6]UFS69001.1 (Fe-S)-binding protein [Geomonas sp. RF6]
MRVQLFGTCMIDSFYPEVGEATVQLLEHFGVEVVFPKGQTCCGQPAFNAGYREEARGAARHFLSVFTGDDPIVTPSGSCAAMVKHHYPELFRDDPRLAEKAARAAARVFEISQFLVGTLRAQERSFIGKGRITYHSSCHLTRMLGVREEPLLLIAALKGAEFVPMPDATRCCGFGGVFMAKLPEISCALAEEKADSVIATGADTVTGGDSACLMTIADALKRRGSTVKAKHLVQLLAEGL